MRKLFVLGACALLVACAAGNSIADDLRGRLALNAKLGVTVPADGESAAGNGKDYVVRSEAGIIGGGGIMYGVDDNVAVEMNVTRSSYWTSEFHRAGVTDLAFGGQYRFPESNRVVPYGGAGLDVLICDLRDSTADTVLGFHLKAGIDYLITRQIALNAEVKGTEAFSADVKDFTGRKFGSFDPSNLAFTVGARLFFN